MSEHRAHVAWRRATADFAYETYDRTHEVRFGSGQRLQGSAAAEYHGDPTKVDPEELFVGALASCHMLTFLAVASKSQLVVDAYEDEAVATLGRNDEGRFAVTRVVLRPRVTFSGEAPARDRLERLHDKAHRACMIAASVKCEVRVEPADG